MNKVTPFLTFDGRCAEAVELYCSLVKNSKIISMDKWGANAKNVPGVNENSVITAQFELDGQAFMAMDVEGGFPKGDGFSLFVDCDDQAEVDRIWEALTANGGKETACGWLVDRFGFSWQIIPKALMDYQSMPDSPKKRAVIDAMLKMKKIIVADLDAAYEKA
jgi:predicted 3-demethylubiquinone-9 3-methyltransferase (glyoxalase superfamily)